MARVVSDFTKRLLLLGQSLIAAAQDKVSLRVTLSDGRRIDYAVVPPSLTADDVLSAVIAADNATKDAAADILVRSINAMLRDEAVRNATSAERKLESLFNSLRAANLFSGTLAEFRELVLNRQSAPANNAGGKLAGKSK
jgi:hypothetical protein